MPDAVGAAAFIILVPGFYAEFPDDLFDRELRVAGEKCYHACAARITESDYRSVFLNCRLHPFAVEVQMNHCTIGVETHCNRPVIGMFVPDNFAGGADQCFRQFPDRSPDQPGTAFRAAQV